MTQMLTHSGETIYLRAFDPRKIKLPDIAHSLAHINRFNGHALRPISVAEHSLMVCLILEQHFQVKNPAALLAGLLHDAHEAYTGDVTQPVKQVLGETWAEFENAAQRTVLKRFGVWTAFVSNHLAIKDADLHALTSEREQLMPAGEYWCCQATHPAIAWVNYRDQSGMNAKDWTTAFLDRADELIHELDHLHANMTGSPA